MITQVPVLQWQAYLYTIIATFDLDDCAKMLQVRPEAIEMWTDSNHGPNEEEQRRIEVLYRYTTNLLFSMSSVSAREYGHSLRM